MGDRSANPFSFLSSLGSRMGHSKDPQNADSGGAGEVGAGAAIQRVQSRGGRGSHDMREDLAAQYDVLIRELASLDGLLRDVPQWSELCRAERALARRGPIGKCEQDEDRQKLRLARQQLSQNRVFVARERIVEAVLLICEEMGRKAPVDALYPIDDEPVTKAADTIVPEGARLPKSSEVHATIRTAPQASGGVSHFKSDPNLPPDDLTRIRSISTPIANKLNELGIRHYSQIANWNAHDVASVRAALSLGGRIARENWIEQAAMLVGPQARTDTDVKNGGRIDGEMKRKKAHSRASVTPKAASKKSRPAKKPSDTSRVSEAAKAIYQQIQSKPAVIEGAPKPSRARKDVKPRETSGETTSAKQATNGTKTPAPDTASKKSDSDAAAEKQSDNLEAIRGIDEAMARQLSKAGVTRFAQISSWQAADIAKIDKVVSCRERVVRECWIEQAAVLEKQGTTAYSNHVAQGAPYQQTATTIAWGGDHAVLPDVKTYWTRERAGNGIPESETANGHTESAGRLTPPPLQPDRTKTKSHDRNGAANGSAEATPPVPPQDPKAREPDVTGTLKERLKTAGANGAHDAQPISSGPEDVEASNVTVSKRGKRLSPKTGVLKTFSSGRKAGPKSRDRGAAAGATSDRSRSSTASYGQYGGHIGEASVSIIRGGKSDGSGAPDTAADVSDSAVVAGQAGHIEIDYSYGQSSGGFARRWLRALLGR